MQRGFSGVMGVQRGLSHFMGTYGVCTEGFPVLLGITGDPQEVPSFTGVSRRFRGVVPTLLGFMAFAQGISQFPWGDCGTPGGFPSFIGFLLEFMGDKLGGITGFTGV